MQAQADALLAALRARPPGAAPLLAAAALPDLPATLAVLPRARHAPLAAAILVSVRALAPAPADEPARRAAAALLGLYLRDKKAPTPPDLRAAAALLVENVEEMRGAVARNAVVKVAEVFWADGRDGREEMVPAAAVVLVERSLAVEVGGASSAEDVKRVYGLRGALCGGGGVDVTGHPRLAPLLLRCATNAMYLRIPEGQRLIARLLLSPQVRGDVHAALRSMLPSTRKSRAVAIGTVYVHAWRAAGASGADGDFAPLLQDLLKRAVWAASDPLATNLRTVLSSFHANKKLNGMDKTLHAVYTPVLFRALTAANPLVRRNAAIILADAFPIHDPAMSNAELTAVLEGQCARLCTLLEDPVPFVRVAAVEGACRVVGLLWELVPPAMTKKMMHFMTASLAFDKASAHVRAAVCDGLRFMLDNHMTHPLMSVVLPRLANLLHDNTERVRISFLALLLVLKEKRIVSARYFDIVPLEDFLLRLPVDTPAVTTRIMQLLVASFFPLGRKNKTRAEISASQVRACLEMVKQSPTSAVAFYSHLSMYAPPGPLVEFCINLASIATAGASSDSGDEAASPNRRPPASGRRIRRRPGRGARVAATAVASRQQGGHASGGEDEQDGSPNKHVLLGLVAIVLQSVAPSLAKASNAELQACVVDTFGGAALKPLLLSRGNSPEARLSCLKIAGSIPPMDINPVGVVWRQQLEAILDSFCDDSPGATPEWIAGLLHCGLSWREAGFIADVVSSWADAAASGRRAASVGAKSSKRARHAESDDVHSARDTLRTAAVRALSACAAALADDADLQRLFASVLQEEGGDVGRATAGRGVPPCLRIVGAVRRGAVAALDAAFEAENGDHGADACDDVLLGCLSASMRLSLCMARPSSGSQNGPAELASPAQLDLLEVIQWASGREALSSALRRSPDFGGALVTIVMTHAADGAALGKLPWSVGARYLAQFASRVAGKIVPAGGERCVRADDVNLRFALSALTAAYHLVHGVLAAEPPVRGREASPRRAPTPAARCEDVHGLLHAAAGILGQCPFTAEGSAADAVVSRFEELLLAFSYGDGGRGEGRCDAVALTLADVLSAALAEAKEVDGGSPPRSALIALLTQSIVKLATKPPRGPPADCARDIAEAMLRALKTQPALRQARFARVVAGLLLDKHHDTTVVSAPVRAVCSALEASISAVERRCEDEGDQHAHVDLIKIRASLLELRVRSDSAGPTGRGGDDAAPATAPTVALES
jgi:hypothetical protein